MCCDPHNDTRSWTDNLRNPGIYWVRLFMFTMLCLMIGTMYLQMESRPFEKYDQVCLLLISLSDVH